MKQTFAIDELLATVTPEHRYHEFLRVSTMSTGVYALPGGAKDMQSPHKEDEIYYIVRGKAKISINGEVSPVEAGSVIFVAAGVEHRFHDIEEELVSLVIFAPPESAGS